MKKTKSTQYFLKMFGFAAVAVISVCFCIWFSLGKSGTALHGSSSGMTFLRDHSLAPKDEIGRRAKTATTEKIKRSRTEDLQAAIFAAQNAGSQEQQLTEMSRLIEDSTKERIVALFNSMTKEQLQSDAALQFFSCWAQLSPLEAASWAQNHLDTETGESLLRLAATIWAKNDVDQAIKWAQSLPVGKMRTEAMSSIGSEAVRFAPLDALRLASELPASKEQSELIRRAVAEWAVTDRDHAMEWVKNLQDVEVRRQALEQVITAAADQDPAKAAHLALEELPEGRVQDRVFVSIIQRWAQADPQAVSSWVREFPEGNLRTDAVENLMNLWVDQDLNAAGNWIKSLPNGKMREESLGYFISLLSQKKTDSATQWMAELEAPTSR